MFRRKRPTQGDASSSAPSNSFSDIEALCDRLCVAFDPGRHATREIKGDIPPSDRLIRTLRTLLRVSRHRRKKIEQSVQSELSTSASLRDTVHELSEQTRVLEQRLAECEEQLEKEALQTQPAQQAQSIASPADTDESASEPFTTANNTEAFESDDDDFCDSMRATAEIDAQLASDGDHATDDDDEIVDLDPATALPPANFADGVDFNALLENAIEEIRSDEPGSGSQPSLGGIEAFESTLAEAEAALDEPTETEATDELTQVASPTPNEIPADDDIPVTSDEAPIIDDAFAVKHASIDAACMRAQSVHDELQATISAAEARHLELTTLNDTLAAQLTRRENLLARVDHELRERQIVLVTDIMRAEAEHLSLTEALEGITRSVQSMTNDISTIDSAPPTVELAVEEGD